MQPHKSKWALRFAIITGATAVALIFLAAASIVIKALAATPSVTTFQMPLWLQATANATPITGTALSASAAAAVAAILAAAHKFGLFRESQPHLSVTQTIYTQQLGQNFRLVAVTAILHNNSKVLVRPTKAWCRLDQTAPLKDEDVQEIINDALTNKSDEPYEQFAWPILAQVDKTWSPGEMVIEPNENAPVVFQFTIGKEATAVHISTAIIQSDQPINQPNQSDTQLHPLAWMCYTFSELS